MTEQHLDHFDDLDAWEADDYETAEEAVDSITNDIVSGRRNRHRRRQQSPPGGMPAGTSAASHPATRDHYRTISPRTWHTPFYAIW